MIMNKLKNNRNHLQTILGDLLQYLPALLVPAIVSLIATSVYSQYFEPAEYGVYSIVNSNLLFLNTFFGWIIMVIIRYYPQYQKEKKLEYFYNLIYRLALLSVAIIVIPYLFYIIFIPNQSNRSILYLSVLIFIIRSSFEIFLQFLRPQRKIWNFSLFSALFSVISFIGAIMLILVFDSQIEYILMGIILSLLVLEPILIISSKLRKISKIKIKRDSILEFIKYSIPLLIGNLGAWFLRQIDKYVINNIMGETSVGIYSPSYSLAEYAVIMLNSLFLSAFTPLLINMWEKETKTTTQYNCSLALKLYLLLGIPMLGGLSIFAKKIVELILDSPYHSGYIIFPLVVLATLFIGISQRYQIGLLFEKKTKYIAYSIFISGILNIGLSILLTSQLGLLGPAISTCICSGLAMMLIIIFSRKYFQFKFPYRDLVKIILISIIMMGLGYLFNYFWVNTLYEMLIAMVVCACFYFLGILLLKTINLNEIKAMFLKKPENIEKF